MKPPMLKQPDRPVFHPELGAYFQGLRARRKLASLRVAERVAAELDLDVKYTDLQRLEAGKTLNPDPSLIRDLSALYKRPYEELVAKFVEARFGTTVEKLGRALGGPAEPVGISVSGSDFGAVPLMRSRIAAGRELVVEDGDYAGTLAFNAKFLNRWKRPICVRVGAHEESMLPLITPDDVVLLECAEASRLEPDQANIYAVRVDGGATLKRVEVIQQDGRAWLALLSENPDKKRYPVRLMPIEEHASVLDYVVGRVVWHGQYV